MEFTGLETISCILLLTLVVSVVTYLFEDYNRDNYEKLREEIDNGNAELRHSYDVYKIHDSLYLVNKYTGEIRRAR